MSVDHGLPQSNCYPLTTADGADGSPNVNNVLAKRL